MSDVTGEYSRKDLLELIIGAVECAQGEAAVNHNEGYVKLCEDFMFPFLEAELEQASRPPKPSRICMVGSRTDDPCTRVAMVGEEGSEPRTCLYHAMQVELQSYHGEIAHALKEAEDLCLEAMKDIFDKGTFTHWELP